MFQKTTPYCLCLCLVAFFNISAKPTNRLVATFSSNPPMNVFPATYTDEVFQVNGQILPRQVQLTPAQTVDLGIRSEHLRITSWLDDDGEENTQPPQLTLEVSVVEPLGRETLVRVVSLLPVSF